MRLDSLQVFARFILATVLLAVCLRGSANAPMQHAISRIDSLTDILKNKTYSDSTRINAFFLLEQSLGDSSLLSSIANEVIISGTNFSDIKGVATAISKKGSALLRAGYYKEAIFYFEIYLKIGNRIRDQQIIADANHFIGQFYRRMGDYANALKYYFEALYISKQIGDFFLLSRVYIRIAWVYLYIDDIENAINHCDQAMHIAKEQKLKSIEHLVDNLYGAIYRRQGDFEKSLMHHLRVIEARQMNKNFFDLAVSYNNIGRVYADMADYQKAFEYYEKSLVLKKELGARGGISRTLRAFGIAYLDMGKYDESISYFSEALSYAKEIKFMNLVISCSEYLAIAYSKTKKYELANQYQSRALFLKDSLFNQVANIRAGKYEGSHELEAFYKKNELLTQRKEAEEFKRNILIGLVFFFVLVFITVYFYLKAQIRVNHALLEKERTIDDMKSRFFINVSHDLRTPLSLIMGPLKDLTFNQSLDNKTAEVVVKAVNQTEQIRRLNNELLELVRLESGMVSAKEQGVMIKNELNKIAAIFDSTAATKEIGFHYASALPEDLCIWLDVNMFEKIMHNLLSYSFKNAGKGDDIWLEASVQGEGITMMIGNTSQKLDCAALCAIFENSPSHSEHSGHSFGLDIGLAMVRELLLLIKGRITIGQSDSETWLTFYLPIVKIRPSKKIMANPASDLMDQLIEEEWPAGHQEETFDTGTGQILIVEDHKDLRLYLEEIVGSCYECKVVSNGRQAWEVLNDPSWNIDMVITDIMMPEMDGFELIDRIKKDEQLAALPVVVLTARNEHEDKMQALLAGVDDYLTKPFDSVELLARCRNLLKNANQRKINHHAAPVEVTDPDEGLSANQRFMKQVETFLRKEIGNSAYGLNDLADDMQVSHRTVHRRIKQMTGLNANSYFREIRLVEAHDMLLTGKYNSVSEVCFATGFETPGYFSKVFFERFGKKPSHYIYETLD